MAARRSPTDDDRDQVIEIALNGLAHANEVSEIAARMAPLHPRNDTFPGEVLLDLAADAISVAGATRQSPLEFEGLRARYLPDGTAHKTSLGVATMRRSCRWTGRTPRRGSPCGHVCG